MREVDYMDAVGIITGIDSLILVKFAALNIFVTQLQKIEKIIVFRIL